MPTGCSSSGRTPATSKPIFFFTFQLAVSITETVPPTSEDTHTSLPSGVNFASRGRVSTSTLATTFWLALSITCAMLVYSEVATVYLESGLTPMPSGSTPTGISAVTSPRLGIHDGHHRVVLVGDVERAALGIDGHQFRVGTGVELVRDRELARCRSRP